MHAMADCAELDNDERLGAALGAEFRAAPWYVSSAAVHLTVFVIALLLWPERMIEQAPTIVVTPTFEEQVKKDFEEPPKPEIKEVTAEVVNEKVKVETTVTVSPEIEIETEEEITEEPVQGDPSDFTDLDTDTNRPALTGIGPTGGAGGRGGLFGAREGQGRRRAAVTNGGSRLTEERVEHALRWLATHQEIDGHWACAKYEGSNADDAVTGLALLAFLGAGNSSKFGMYKKNAAAAQQWLLNRQGPDGHFGRYRYEAAMTLMAMCEAYGMSEDYNLEAPVQRAVDAACAAQNGDGGWRYTPGNGYGGGGGQSDTSVSGWWMMALKSAKVAKLHVPKSTWDGAKKWFSAQGIAAGNGYDWKGRYQPGGGAVAIPTAALMCCRQFLGYGQHDEIIVGCANNLIQQNVGGKGFLPGTKTGQGKGSQNFYLWYYEALGFFQLGTENEHWQTFNGLMKKELLNTQRRDGTYEQFKGSWDPANGHSFHGGDQWGRVGQTAVGALMLEVYYRYAMMKKMRQGR